MREQARTGPNDSLDANHPAYQDPEWLRLRLRDAYVDAVMHAEALHARWVQAGALAEGEGPPD